MPGTAAKVPEKLKTFYIEEKEPEYLQNCKNMIEEYHKKDMEESDPKFRAHEHPPTHTVLEGM